MTFDADGIVARRRLRRRLAFWRVVAIVVIGAFVCWGLLQALGAQYELSRRTMGLGDSVALVAMGWAMYEAVMIWRLRREKE